MARGTARRARVAWGALLAFGWLACASPSGPGASREAAPRAPAPETLPAPAVAPRDTGMLFLWEVEGGPPGAAAWLLGSVHMARPDLRLDPAVEAAFAESATLVVELDLRELDDAQSRDLVLQNGTLPEGERLEAQVSPETWQAFSDLLERNGQSPAAYQRFEPWVAMLVASTLLAAEQDLSGEHGVDLALLERAGDREVVPLETLAFQLSLFDDLTLEQQARLLESLVLETRSGAETLGILYEAWELGDTDAVAALVFGSSEEEPELAALQERIFVDRNRAMADRIEELLQEPQPDGDVFVVVGAGHMVGDRGIPALLEGRGHRVRRVERSP